MNHVHVKCNFMLLARVTEPKGNLKCLFPMYSLQGWTDTEADVVSVISRPVSKQLSYETGKYAVETSDTKAKSKPKSHDSGIFEKVINAVHHPSPQTTNELTNLHIFS